MTKLEFLAGVFQQALPRPWLLLVQLLMLQWLQLPQGYLLFAIALGCSLLLRRHYFWWVGIVLHLTLSSYLRAINLVAGLASCSSPLSTLLYCYVAGRLLLMDSSLLQTIYSMVVGALLLIYIFSRLPAKAKEVKELFQALSVVWVAGLVYVLHSIVNQSRTVYLVQLALMLPLAYIVSGYTMDTRLKHIIEGEPNNLGQTSHALIFIEDQRNRLNSKLDGLGIEEMHRGQCHNSQCFCRKPETDSRQFFETFIMHLYGKFIERFNSVNDKLQLNCSLVEYLLERGIMVAAIECDIKFRRKYRPTGFYSWLRRAWLNKQLQKQIEVATAGQNFNRLVRELHGYERNFEQLREMLRELLTLKVSYWRELCQRSCKVLTIRNIAETFLEKFNVMHKFYLDKIKQTEQEAGLLMGGIIYNLFLMVATNYKNLSDDNIKEIRKQHESSTGLLNVRKKYYCLTASVRDDKLGQIENHTRNLGQLLASKEELNMMLVGQNIDRLIPQPYLPLHRTGITSLNKRPGFHLIGGPFSNLFVLSMNKRLIPCDIQVEFCTDLLNQLSIVALFRKEQSDCQHMLLDCDGMHLYSSGSHILHQRLIEQEVFQRALQKFSRGNKLEPAKFQLSFSSSLYSITLTSPHLRAFQESSKRPPIYVELLDESHNRMADRTFIDDLDNVNNMNKLNRFIDMAEESSQASEISRPNEIITFLRAFQIGPTINVFRILFGLIVAANIFAVALVSMHHFIVQLDWIVQETGQANHFKVEQTLLDIQLQAARVLSKGLSLYAIDSGIITDSAFLQSYQPDVQNSSTYAAIARQQIRANCDSIKSLLADNLSIYDDGIGDSYISTKLEQLNVVTSRTSQHFSYSGLLRKFVSDGYDLSAGVPFQTMVGGEVFWQTIFPQSFKMLSSVVVLNQQEIGDYLDQNKAFVGVNLSVLLIILLPVYLISRKVVKQENFIYELMAGLDSQQMHTQIEKLEDFNKSLKQQTSNSQFELERFDDHEEGQQLLQKNDEFAGSLTMRSEKGYRKRAGSLDYVGNYRFRPGLYLLTLIYLLLMGGLFVVKQMTLEGLISQLSTTGTEMNIRNERLHLLLNIKKQIYGWQPDELIMGMTVADWNLKTITQRKLHNPVTYSAAGTKPNTSPQSLNSNFLGLATQVVVAQEGHLIPYMQSIEELSDQLRNLNEPEDIRIWQLGEQFLLDIGNVLYGCNFLAFLICGGYGLMEVQRMKTRFISVVRSLSFLNEQMIRSSKRVHSFMQRIAKEQQ